MGLRSNHMVGTSYEPLGQTPIIPATGQRFGCNMIAVMTSRGHLTFMVFHGKFDARLFIRFMQPLLSRVAGKLYLTVDGHSVHRSVLAPEFVSANANRLRLIGSRGYCAELNPNELLQLYASSERSMRATQPDLLRIDHRPAQ